MAKVNGKKSKAKFKFQPFSIKQKQLLTWWMQASPHFEKDVIIADGSVRSGKTIIMSLSYVIWSMENFNYCNFGLAGKTIGSFRRNVLFLLKIMLTMRGYRYKDHRADNMIEIYKDGHTNFYYIFGGKDEKSQDLVQGLTAAGFLFDEVSLMPQSFVNQAVARCSVDGAKIWFNCNPDGPFHWFKIDWLDQLEEKNALHIHFTMDDNPSLSDKVKERYKRMFAGIFYERFILGLWVLAEGVIYSMFRRDMVINELPIGVHILKKWIGIDYGQSNATVFLLIGLGTDNKMYILDEYYHSGKTELIQKSPSKYSKDYFEWKIANGVDGVPVRVENTFVDPSAKGFITQLFEDGERGIRQADNDVLKGIELVSSIIDSDMLRVLSRCQNTIKELSAYRWDPKAQQKGEDKPVKEEDHAMDALRYTAMGTRMIWQRLLSSKPAAKTYKINRV